MFINPEQFAAAQRNFINTIFSLSNKSVEGFERIVALNVATTKAVLEEQAEKSKEFLTVKDAQELVAFNAGLAQPTTDKAVSYGRKVYEIIQNTQGEFVRAFEVQVAENNKHLSSFIDNASKNAPAGTESAVSFVKSTFTAANNAYETFSKAAKQAVEVAEANVNAAANATVKAAEGAAAAARSRKQGTNVIQQSV